MLYHLNLTWAQGGFLGVTIFFVLWIPHHPPVLPEFEQTRPDRPQAVLGAARAAPCARNDHARCRRCRSVHDLQPRDAHQVRPDILPSLFFFNNWWQIAQNARISTHWRSLRRSHFWSLAIEHLRRVAGAPAHHAEAARQAPVDAPHCGGARRGIGRRHGGALRPAADPSGVSTAPIPARSPCCWAHGWRSSQAAVAAQAELLQTVGLGKLPCPKGPRRKSRGEGSDSAQALMGKLAGRSAPAMKRPVPAGSTGKQIGGQQRLASDRPMRQPTTRRVRLMRSASSPWRPRGHDRCLQRLHALHVPGQHRPVLHPGPRGHRGECPARGILRVPSPPGRLSGWASARIASTCGITRCFA